jgi:hypothetical protein
MTTTLPLATALPENTGDGYVAAAYIVFFVILLIYVAIMALRLSHVQRDLRDLQARSSPSAGAEPPRPGGLTGPQTPAERSSGTAPPAPDAAADEPHEQTLEREPA